MGGSRNDYHSLPDPKDNKILALAVDGRATRIVTGDNDLLSLDPFHGIRIERPDQFLERLPSHLE